MRSLLSCAPVGLLCIGLLGAGCGESGGSGAPPPLPEALERLDPFLVLRIREVHSALQAELASAQRWMDLGMTYEANGLGALALDCYQRALALEETAKTWSRIAQAQHGLGDVTAAAAAMQTSVRIDPSYAPSHWRLGSYLFDLGRFDEARTAYRSATEADPDHTGGWIGLARIHLQEDRPDAAVKLLEDLLRRSPEDAPARRLLRTAYTQAGQPPGAARASWLRVTSPGKDPWHREFRGFQERPLMERALAELTSGEPGAAIEILEPFVADNPTEMNALSYLAWGYYLDGRRADALAAIDRALQGESSSIAVLRVLAQIEGDAGGAIDVFGRILELDPYDMEALEERGRVEHEIGRHEDAIATLDRLLELDTRDSEVWLQKGRSELELARWEDAARSFRTALERNAKGDVAPLGLARAYGGLGRWSDAESALSGIPELGPTGRQMLESIRARKAASPER